MWYDHEHMGMGHVDGGHIYHKYTNVVTTNCDNDQRGGAPETVVG